MNKVIPDFFLSFMADSRNEVKFYSDIASSNLCILWRKIGIYSVNCWAIAQSQVEKSGY
jgi:hypothetical protein